MTKHPTTNLGRGAGGDGAPTSSVSRSASIASKFAILLSFVAAFGCVLLAAGSLSAQPDPAAKFREAESHVKAGRLIEAAEIFRSLSQDEKSPHRGPSLERLIEVYPRLGRCDRAIEAGDCYRASLAEGGDLRGAKLLDVQLAACWWALGHHAVAEKMLAAMMANDLDEFPLNSKLNAWELLARCRAKRGDQVGARASWAAIESLADRRLRELPPDADERLPLTRRRAESLRGQERYAEAEVVFKNLLPQYERRKDDESKGGVWCELASLYREQGKLVEADAALDEALKAHARHFEKNPMARGDLEAERSEVSRLRKDGAGAKRWRDLAIEHYQEALKNPETIAATGGSPVLVFWKLQNLVQVAQQFRRALELTQTQAELWAGGSLLSTKVESEKGGLHYLLGATKTSRQELRTAVDALERQRPWNLIELPRAYVNLAAVEASTDGLDKAETLIQRTFDLYGQYSLPDDAVIVEACLLRGSVMARRGEYARAIASFREGLRRCVSPTPESPLQRSNLLLNVALLHKSQGEVPEAIRLCGEALAEFAKFADPDALGFAAFDAGLANMHLSQNRIADAGERIARIARLCKLHGVDGGPLVTTSQHVRAIVALSRRDVSVAEEIWRDLLKLQESEEQTLLLPRTLNYLGLAAEAKKDRPAAEDFYRRALKLQTNNPRAYPATQFISHWRLANVLEPDRRDEALTHLDAAVRLVEATRLRTFGDARQRATFFAQFAPAFDQSVEWRLAGGDIDGAFAALTRGRSRTLMDQLQTADLDPLASLVGPEAETLKRREAALRQELAAIRARASFVGVDGLTPAEIKSLLAEFDRAQAAYAETWREIWNASPEYHSLADPTLPEQILPKLRERVLRPKTALLVFYVGRESSCVLLLGGAGVASRSFPLTVPEAIARNIAPPESRDVGRDLAGLRGVALTPKASSKQAAPLPLPPQSVDVKRVPLTQAAARALIDGYRQEILSRDFSATRGVAIRAKDPDRPLPPQRPDLIGDIFLPKALRERLRELALETVVVVPDGPLHAIPLESFLLEAGAKPRFVVDELPPLIYVPSAAILALLADRPALPRGGSGSLLTVSNPAYPVGKELAADVRDSDGVLGFAGQLPRLPFTDFESKQIRRFFSNDRATSLAGADATERNVARAVGGKAIVHIAAHGFADPRFGNLFGALALTPPAGPTANSDDDGFLSLHEIYRLPLRECDLAVLSACLTHVGPQQPLEAGVTLANGFLSAGARRVVASHWNVADRSTSQLMSSFFEALTRDGDRPLSVAQALQEARLRLRASGDGDWSAPFYWAPFVVLGTP